MNEFVTEAELERAEEDCRRHAEDVYPPGFEMELRFCATLREAMRLLEEVGNELHRPSASTSVEACWNEVERFIAAYKGEEDE